MRSFQERFFTKVRYFDFRHDKNNRKIATNIYEKRKKRDMISLEQLWKSNR